MFSKKRTVIEERRVVQEKWKILYFFAEVNEKPTCLICNKNVAVAKEYNIRRHYTSTHATKYDEYSGKLREETIRKLEQSLNKQQSVFKRVHQASDAAVRASYRIAQEIAVSSKPFSEGNFIKKYMLMAAEDICPEKRQAFANISLSRNTVADRINELSENLNCQLKEKVAKFVAFSVASDESTDVSDIAQLAVYIRGVDENMQVTEELVELVPMKGTTTGNDIFVCLVGTLDKIGVDWTKTVSVAIDGAPQMVGRKVGVATKLKEKLLAMNSDHQIHSVHCIIHREVLCSKTLKMDHVMDVVIKTVNFIRARGLNHRQFNSLLEEIHTNGLPYHTDVRWLSRGVVLKRFYELRSEIQRFMHGKGRDVQELKDNEWIQDLAFMVDITEHLHYLNTRLQGRNKLVTDLHDSIRAFELKLKLFERQLAASNTAHFPTLKSMQDEPEFHGDFNTEKYCNKITKLVSEFGERFADFKNLEYDFSVFRNPFSVNADEAPEHFQLELIELQCNSVLKDKFSSVDIDTFYQYVGVTYPRIKCLALKIMAMFGSTYVCEQLFSVMKLNKSRLRSQLTDGHLNSTLKVATAQSLLPNIDALVQAKRCQVSGSSNARN